MFSGLWKLACYFEKFAALKWDEDKHKWIPEKFRKLQPFEDYPSENLIKEFEKFGLQDFRVALELTEQEKNFIYEILGKDLLNTMYNELADVEFYIGHKFYGIYDAIGEGIKKREDFTPEQIAKADEFKIYSDQIRKLERVIGGMEGGKYDLDWNDIKLPEPVTLGKRTFQAGMSIFKLYKYLEGWLAGLGLKIKPLEEHKAFKGYSKRPNKRFIVFSTQLGDLAGIGERGISTCQSLFKERRDLETGDMNIEETIDQYNKCLVGTILSKYIGVIYVTSGSDYEGRGEKMLYRALVRLVYDRELKENVILVDQVYPGNSLDKDEWAQTFRNILQSKTSLKVKRMEEYSNPAAEFDPLDETEETFPDEFTSYKDFDTLKDLKRMSEDRDWFNRQYAAERLPKDSPILENMLGDTHIDVASRAAERVPLQTLKKFLKEVFEAVRYGKTTYNGQEIAQNHVLEYLRDIYQSRSADEEFQ